MQEDNCFVTGTYIRSDGDRLSYRVLIEFSDSNLNPSYDSTRSVSQVTGPVVPGSDDLCQFTFTLNSSTFSKNEMSMFLYDYV